MHDSFRTVDFLLFRPSRDLGEIARECADSLPRIIRSLARGLGAEGHGGAEFLSYLLFDPAYTSRLVELGYADGISDWDRVERLLASVKTVPDM
jgi:NTE family protein